MYKMSSRTFLFVPSNETHVKLLLPLAENLEEYAFMIISERYENAEKYLRTKDIEYLSYPKDKISDVDPNIIIFGNDWGKEEQEIILEAKRLGIPTICVQEGPLDFYEKDNVRMKIADYVFLQGEYTLKHLKRENCIVTGNPKYDEIMEKPLPDKNRIMVNSNFTYGVFENERDDWIKQVCETIKESGRDYFISQHPRDTGEYTAYNVEKSDAFKLYAQIEKSCLLISRFSTVIYEALLMGRPVIYYNPHGETMPYFNDDETEGIYKAYDEKELGETIVKALKNHEKDKVKRKRFLELHCGPQDH